MKLRLVDLLVCPIDRTPLHLVEWELSQQQLNNNETKRAERLGIDPLSLSTEVSTGLLLNPARKIFYPIYQGIPRLTVFPTGVVETFMQLYDDRIRGELPGFRPADGNPMPGEEDVLRTFSSEWLGYGWDERAYWNLTPDEMYKCMHFLLDLDQQPVREKLVLEVGIGIGGIADFMARNEGCELIGIDLSYTVDAASLLSGTLIE